MSDLYVLMEFLTSLSSSDDDELILTEHKKKQSENKKLHWRSVLRKMSDETVSFAD